MKLLVLSALFATAFTQNLTPSPVILAPAADINLHDGEKLVIEPEIIQITSDKQGFNARVDPIFDNSQILLGKEEFNRESTEHNHEQHQGSMPGREEFNQPILGQQEYNPSVFTPNHPIVGKEQFNKPILGRQEQNPSIDTFNHPILGKDEFNQPILGREEYNPSTFTPNHPMPGSQQFNPFEFVPNQPMIGSEEFNPSPFFPPPPPRPYGDSHDHKNLKKMPEDGHQQYYKHQKKMWKKFLFVAFIFTIIGACLGKCCRKCKKNKKKHIQQIIRRSRTAIEVGQEIKEQEKKLAELKSEFELKRTEEIRRQQEAQFRCQQTEMRHMNQVNYYPQQPQQQYYYYSRAPQVAVGRPINDNTNFQFVNEYPQL